MALLLVAPFSLIAHAEEDEGFSLQVSPSPLVATVQPGTDETLELQIRNTNASSQALKMGLRSFTIDSASGQVKLGETVSSEISSMVSFAAPSFTLEAGQIFTQRITIHTDKNKGFSYNFAVTISQQNPPKGTKGQSAIAGSVAVFTLITVDKPGAVRKFELSSLSVSKHSYEYLPAEVSLKLKNNGNVNVQPTGTVFIQRHSGDTTPIAALPLNNSGGYILPGTSRTFTIAWNDGLPHYETSQNGDKPTRELTWHGAGLSKLRFGRYVAKVVAVYDDGERDVPIMAEVSFWVIPWRIILLIVVAAAILLVGVFVTIRSIGRAARRASRKINHTTSKNHTP
jgi:hypothetical protein